MFKPQRHEPSEERNKSSDWCHSAPPRRAACHRALTAPLGKALCHFLKCHLEGCSCKLHTLLVSFSPTSPFSRVVIHSHKKRRRLCAGRIHTAASFENHTACHSSPFLRRGPDRSAFFPCALRASSKTFYLSAEILSPPALCFNSEKQAGAHLSALPYLQPRRVSRGPRYESGYSGGWEGSW